MSGYKDLCSINGHMLHMHQIKLIMVNGKSKINFDIAKILAA